MKITMPQLLNQTAIDVKLEATLIENKEEKLTAYQVKRKTTQYKMFKQETFAGLGTRLFRHQNFNSFEDTYMEMSFKVAYHSNDREQNRRCKNRVLNVEHGYFTPLVLHSF